MNSPKRSVSAISLLETVLVIAAIGILAAVAVMRQGPSLEDVRVAKLQCDLATINGSLKAYIGNGGSVSGITAPQAILNKMKSTRTAEDDATFVGFGGTAIDARLAVHMMDESDSTRPRAVWNASSGRFELATSGAGVESFYLDDALGQVSYGTEERTASTFAFNSDDGWIWSYTEQEPITPPTPTPIVVTNVPGGGGSGGGGGGGPTTETVVSRLSPPSFSVSGGSFRPTLFPSNVTLINPNPAETSRILVSIDGGEFQVYATALSLVSGKTLAAFVTGDPALWLPSSTVENVYTMEEPTELSSPVISASSGQFLWDTAETVSVSISNPNDGEYSSLEYQVGSSGWQTYSGSFELSIDAYPDGAPVSARAIPLTEDYSESPVSATSIAAPPEPEQLLAPRISTSAPNFVIHQIETIQITIQDLNEAGAALTYRIDGGAWESYSSPFNVTREAYRSGLLVEAQAQAISRAYSDSDIQSAEIGLTAVQLKTPAIATSAPNFLAGTVETVTVTITNPNASGSALEYRLPSGSWQTYSAPFPVTRATYPTGLIVEARAKSDNPAFSDSDSTSAEVGLSPIQLLAPIVTPSAPNFVAGSIDTISVTLTNPNSTGSALDYRLNGGSWLAYSGPFTLARSSYANGVLVEGRARATSAAYATSDYGSASIGLTAVQLRSPSIGMSASSFVAGSVESIAVTLTNPNSEGSALEYRLAGGEWTAYAAAFPVTRATYATGLTIDARARSTSAAFLDSDSASSTIDLTPVQLNEPSIALSQPNFMAGSVEVISITLSDNNAEDSELDYRIDSGSWETYTGSIEVTREGHATGLTIEARARATSPAYATSETASASVGLTPVPLQAPEIDRSASNFMAGSVETITVTLQDLNATGSALDYRLNDDSWIAYSGSFTLTRENYPSGLTVSARARSTSEAYLNSDISSSSIGLTPAQLQTPGIAKSQPNFTAGSIESILVTLTNPNATGSIVDYRLNGGNWQSYSNPFSVTRNSFPTGLLVEARARSISPAYNDSGLAASTIGLDSVQLQTPVITPSAPNFVAGSVESISIRLTDLNTADSTLQYRIGSGSWQTYSAPIGVTRATYASGLTVTARAISTSPAYTNSGEASTTIGLTAVRLQAPVIGTSASNFVAASVETISITLTNPNSTGSALDYRINGGSWQAYSAAFNVTRTTYPSGLTVEGRARATQAAYTDSTIAAATIGLTAVRLQTPAISPSAPNFVAGTVETISVSITNPNTTGSALDYRINGGAWQAYTTALSVTRATYASGLTVEARARATSSAYTDSGFASSVIGLTPVQLRTPSIALSAPNFIAASVETISVTITNPNTTGSALEYRINAGSWTSYTAALSVTRATYASGLTVEARARATQAAYTDSTSATASIGLTVVQLRTPTISPSRSDFIAGTVETISVTITNPNTTGSTLQYRLNSGAWTNYTAAFNVTRSTYPSGVAVEARALSTNVAYTTSDTATASIGLSSVQLRTPTITPTAPNFAAGSVETINVSISNPNTTGSVLEYRLNTGAWQTYSATFTLTRASYPNGATVEARARSTSAAFTNSDNALASLGLTAVPLVAPTISPSSPNFMAGSVETISVSISNPNATGSILEYRLNTGSWTTYSSAFSVTRSSYPAGLTVEARARSVSAAFTTSATTTSTIGLTAVQLQAPTIARSFPNFVSGSVETVTITLSNPNPSGSSTLQYRLAGGAWTNYGSAFNLSRSSYPSGVTVEAKAKTASAAYLDSTSASVTIGVGAVQLQPPSISPSAPNFMAGSVETISVSLTNPNPSGSSSMEYRLSTGSWQNYSSAFSVTRSNYPSGLTIEARSRASSSAYTNSTNSSATIGLTPVQLGTPVITSSANNFMVGSMERISVSISNPNSSGSSLEYRLAGGSWISYSGSFNVSRTSYPSGVLVESRARSTSAAFSDSLTASRSIGLTPVQLQSPTIRKSAPYFAAGVVETVSITIINPNSTGSSLEYRLNGGSWITYSNAFNVTRATYRSGVTIEARARATSAAYLDSPIASATVAVNTDPVQRVTVTFSSLSSSAGYLNESFIYVNGDGYYLGNSDMGAGFTVNVDVYVNPYVTNVFDLTIDTYMRNGRNFISGALRGMDTQKGSQFTVISPSASFAGASPNAGKIKDLSTSSNLRMVVGYEDLIITGGSPDYDYDDFQFEVRAPANFNLIFGGFHRGL